MELPPGIGPYEQWPGYKRLKNALNVFLDILHIKEGSGAVLEIVEIDNYSTATCFGIKDLRLVIPNNKTEFEKSGHAIRVVFKVDHDNQVGLDYLDALAPTPFDKKHVHQVTLRSYSGASNRLTAIYSAMILNKHRPEIYIQSLTNNEFEIGLDAAGNLFDSLLISTDMVPDEDE